MGKPPLSTFRGHLKQTSSRDYDPKFRPLLDPLFPHFFESIGSWEDHPETIRTWREGLPSHVSMEFLDYQVPRRFGGYDLPRGRYFTVCEDSTGNDHGTLVHELRAYRNPARSGMIDVLDFGLGNNTLLMGTREVCIPRSQHWGVLIDDCDRVAGLLDGVPHELLLHSDGSTKILVKVPYRVSNACCERTIDLRSAEARQWFFEYFST